MDFDEAWYELEISDENMEVCTHSVRAVPEGLENVKQLTPINDARVEVSVGTGDAQKTWFLPEQLLCDHSEYFRAAFKGGFEESVAKKINLEEHHHTAFAHFVDWICSGKLECRLQHSNDGRVRDGTHCLSVCGLFVLADIFGMTELAQKTVSQVQQCLSREHRLPSPEEVCFVYENTVNGSSMQASFVDRMTKDYLVRQSFASCNKDMEWVEAVGANCDLHCEVMEKIKEHTLLPDCEWKKCTLNNSNHRCNVVAFINKASGAVLLLPIYHLPLSALRSTESGNQRNMSQQPNFFSTDGIDGHTQLEDINMSQQAYVFPSGGMHKHKQVDSFNPQQHPDFGYYEQMQPYFAQQYQAGTFTAIEPQSSTSYAMISANNTFAVDETGLRPTFDPNPAPAAPSQTRVVRETYVNKHGKTRTKNAPYKQRLEYAQPQVSLTEAELKAIRPSYQQKSGSSFAKHPDQVLHRIRVTIPEREALKKYRLDRGAVVSDSFGKNHKDQEYQAAQKRASDRYEKKMLKEAGATDGGFGS
ncbi:uncharacterized protein PAC_03567 [Phialocephala subalpina]|uniref:BTB domain-containing protein n=1 Tax=Phialocephala subalpina TaxID=576137 RepID=A0A1L7WLN8_9HELO|nr:uncharacterized protein PAC_03567 [Phialocephala subalpina]